MCIQNGFSVRYNGIFSIRDFCDLLVFLCFNAYCGAVYSIQYTMLQCSVVNVDVGGGGEQVHSIIKMRMVK